MLLIAMKIVCRLSQIKIKTFRQIFFNHSIDVLFIQQLWYLASCMDKGQSENFKLSPGLPNGLTREELLQLENDCSSRITLQGDPPIFLQIVRKDSGESQIFLIRWSESKKMPEVLFNVSANSLSYEGEMFADQAAMQSSILPVLQKLADARERII